MSIFALVDCNNFYVSCERVFNPKLEAKPVIVLSNNDGCVISRSNEAKKLGIPMGAPFYKWEAFCEQNHVYTFSSNYELYGDLSRRVMLALKHFCPHIEIYSIDEAFLELSELSDTPVEDYMQQVRAKVKHWTGMPVSIGIGATKTLAKIANTIAKNTTVENVYQIDNFYHNKLLSDFPVEKIWGVGRQLAKRLHQLQISTAQALQQADAKMIRLHFSVTAEKIVRELNGISCLPLEAMFTPRKQIVCSRSFGKPVTELEELQEAISHYSAVATKKLRNQHCVAGGIYVFIETNYFNLKMPYYSNNVFFPFPIPTQDTSYIIRIAKKCIRHLYKKNLSYHKVGVILTELIPQNMQQQDILQVNSLKNERLIQSVDVINKKFGKDTLFYCAEGISREWKMITNKLSPRYSTRWDELAVVT